MNKYNYKNPRTGKECKKTKCKRHKDYMRWDCGCVSLDFCMQCKHSHVSQYEREEQA